MKELGLLKVTKENQERFGEIDFSLDLMKFITGSPLSTEEAIVRYSFNLDHEVLGTYFVELASNSTIIGIAVIKDISVHEAEIGYMILDGFTGRGYATQVNKRLVQICRSKIPERQITAFVDIRNKPSIRVLEKCQMKHVDSIEDGEIKLLKYLYKD